MPTTASTKRKRQQQQAIFRLLLLAGILLCINLLASRFHKALDLTREKRFTLSPATEKLLGSLDETLVVTVYLKNDNMGADFQRLAEAARDRLESFRNVIGGNLVYRFTNPFEGKSEDEKAKIFQTLRDKGILGLPIRDQSEGESYSENILFPYALVQYKEREATVSMLDNHMGMGRAEVLNYSEALLEYKIARAIALLSRPAKPTIGYITGHGETIGVQTLDALNTLAGFYRVDTFDLSNNIFIPKAYDAVIIARPTIPFSDKEKFKIDQYVMAGGKILWYLDAVNAPLDSLRGSEAVMAADYGLNLDDLLFRYGVRLNSNLIQQWKPVADVPYVTEQPDADGKPQIGLRPWEYLPIFLPSSKHPIVNNMDGILGMFASSLDTIGASDIRKTILLESSEYSRTAPTPIRVMLPRFNVRAEMYNHPYQPVAVLLEGRFKSVFQNRLAPSFLQVLRDSIKREFKAVSDTETSMIVVADGNMFENQFSNTTGPMEMGYWEYDKANFANKAFLLNCMEYLTEPGSPLEARSKDLKLRMLDTNRAKLERSKWQWINVLVPIGLVLIFASAYLFFRKRRYEVKA